MSARTADTLADSLRPLTDQPAAAAIMCDIDGTLAPIVERAEDARLGDEVRRLLARLARTYGCVACVSGRSASDARRLVGVRGIFYAGSHGAELLEPGAERPGVVPKFEGWEARVRRFAAAHDGGELRAARVRIEDKGPITAFHWRGVPDEGAAQALLEDLAREARAEGFATHWGRKVLEVRPPVPIDKGRTVRELVARAQSRTALFGGDDTTDLDAFDALDALVEEGTLDGAVRVGVRSEEGPSDIVERADLAVEGVPGFTRVLEALAEAR